MRDGMVTIRGVRYRVEDALRLGLIKDPDPAKSKPVKARKPANKAARKPANK